MKCEVLVIGGGGAGLAAAVTAARAGAHTVLVERHGVLGGMATVALVHSVCGLYLLRDEPEAVYAHPGFPSEFAERLIRAGAAAGPTRMGRVDVLLHSPPGFAAVGDAVVAECPSLEVRLHTEVIAARGDGRVEALDFFSRGNHETVEPQVVIDASGDGVLADLLHVPADQAPASQLQRPAFIFALHSVDVDALDSDGRIRVACQIAAAVRAGQLDEACLGAHFRTSGRGSEVYATVDLSAEENFDPTDASQLCALEQTGRRVAMELTAYLRREHAGFVQAQIAAFPARIGVRESRRIRGLATVTSEDVLQGTVPADPVALGTWPIELRERPTGPRWRFPIENRPTQIPLRALQAATMENLWIAGRCISCDHEAQAALRVIGTCLATGQAAGAAAALQAQAGVCPSAEMVRNVISPVSPHAVQHC